MIEKNNFKLIFGPSNPPKITETDEGIWRRVKFIPIRRTIETKTTKGKKI